MSNVLEVKHLTQAFDISKGILDKIKLENGKLAIRPTLVHAINDVSFKIDQGEIFSLVGESGCGKSTIARTITRLLRPKSGRINFLGQDITNLSKSEMLVHRRRMQMIFQDPYASLNPRQKVLDIIVEPIRFHKIEGTKSAAVEHALSILNRVGIRPEQANRYPHQFSGGQRQRIGIARALAVSPEFIVADEPVSALDVSIQAQILNLLVELKEEFGFSYLFIAHDLSVVKHISDRVAVMYLGKIVEQGTVEQIFNDPKHPYTCALLEALPRLSGNNMINSKGLEGEVQSAISLPKGCYFYGRCPRRIDKCHNRAPNLKSICEGHTVACHLAESEVAHECN